MWRRCVRLISNVIQMGLMMLFPRLASFLCQSTHNISTDNKTQVPYNIRFGISLISIPSIFLQLDRDMGVGDLNPCLQDTYAVT
jgi:hypothetical protein